VPLRNYSHSKTQKSYFDARVKAISFSKGQLVWLYWPKPLLWQHKRKLTQLWFGPYRITEFKSEAVVQIQHIRTGKTQIVHVDRLMHCTTVPDITSPRNTSATVQIPSVGPPPVFPSVPTQWEHQAPAVSPSQQNQPLRRSTRVARPPNRLTL